MHCALTPWRYLSPYILWFSWSHTIIPFIITAIPREHKNSSVVNRKWSWSASCFAIRVSRVQHTIKGETSLKLKLAWRSLLDNIPITVRWLRFVCHTNLAIRAEHTMNGIKKLTQQGLILAHFRVLTVRSWSWRVDHRARWGDARKIPNHVCKFLFTIVKGTCVVLSCFLIEWVIYTLKHVTYNPTFPNG